MGRVVTVTINNWDKYNPRRDYKKPHWFALSNRLVEDADFFDFNHGEFKAWIYILSRASQKNSEAVEINHDHAERVCRIKESDLNSAIKKLERLKVVTAICTDDEQNLYISVQTTNATIQTNNTEQTNKQIHAHSGNERVRFDFESLYQKYPHKVGKQKGLKKCEKEIQSQDDYDGLARAIDRFAEYHQGKGTEAKYISHFSTFMSEWKDWLDPTTGTAEVGTGYRGIDQILGEEKSA